jgi:hypothetical protein
MMMSNSNGNIMKKMAMNDQDKKRSVSKNNNNRAVLNVDSQTVKGLAAEALEIFNKDLKPAAPLNATQANAEAQTYLAKLKEAIDKYAVY